MVRNLKAFGLVAGLVLCLGSVTATPAAGVGNFTSPSYPQHLTSTDVGEVDTFTLFGTQIRCSSQTLTGTLKSASSSLSFTPTYSGCKTEDAPSNNVTATHNGCSLDLTVAIAGTDEAAGYLHVNCPSKPMEFHHSPYGEIKECIGTMGTQKAQHTFLLKSNTEAKDLSLEGTVTLTAQYHGECLLGFTANVLTPWHFNMTVQSSSGESVHIG